jgi:hypothetical protein
MGSDYLLFTEVKVENEWHCMKLHGKQFLQSWEFYLNNYRNFLPLALYHLTSGITVV